MKQLLVHNILLRSKNEIGLVKTLLMLNSLLLDFVFF